MSQTFKVIFKGSVHYWNREDLHLQLPHILDSLDGCLSIEFMKPEVVADPEHDFTFNQFHYLRLVAERSRSLNELSAKLGFSRAVIIKEIEPKLITDGLVQILKDRWVRRQITQAGINEAKRIGCHDLSFKE